MKYSILKRTINVLLSLCFCLPAAVQSQSSYPNGVYKSRQDLYKKSPDRSINFTVERRTKGDIMMVGGEDYKVVSSEINVNKQEIRNDWFAVSIDSTLYLNTRFFRYSTWYTKALNTGKILAFESAGGANASGATFGAVGGAIAGASQALSRRLSYYNIVSGEFGPLDKRAMNKILSSNPSLSDAYSVEQKKNDAEILLAYLEAYNLNTNLGSFALGSIDSTSAVKVKYPPIFLVVYRPKARTQGEKLDVRIGDSTSVNMSSGSYWSRRIQAPSYPLEICLEDSLKCVQFSKEENYTRYIKVGFSKEGNLPTISEVGKSEGEWDSELARKAQMKRDKQAKK